MLMDIHPRILAQSLAIDSLPCFSQIVKPDFIWANHHQIINIGIKKLFNNEFEKLLILTPPRHSKSSMVSQLLPAQKMTAEKTEIVLATYGAEIALDHGRRTKQILTSESYLKLFDTRVTIDSNSNTRFHMTNESSWYSTGIGGALTGKGFDLGIIDDPIKRLQDALNKDHQKNIMDWYQTVFLTRRLKHAKIILAQTLWSQLDLGYQLPRLDPSWHVILLPAINAQGEALWPEMFAIDELLKTKATIGTYAFESLYQQNPTPLEGNIVKRHWIRTVPSTAITTFAQGRQIISVDTSFDGDETSDFNSIQVWQEGKGCHVLIHQARGKWEFTKLVHEFKNICALFPKAHKKIVEKSANGSALASQCRKDGYLGIELVPVVKKGDKSVRLSVTTPLFEAGNVYFAEAQWTNELVEELVSFPSGNNDDMVDTLSQYLMYIMNKPTAAFA